MGEKEQVEGQGIFRSESKLTKSLEGLYHLFVLNVFFIIFSLPILTIGMAQTSLCRSITAIREEKDCQPLPLFIESLKKSWKMGLKIGLVELILGLILLTNMFVLQSQVGSLTFLFQAIYLGLGLLVLITCLYVIPLSCRKEEKGLMSLFKDSFLIACLHLPWSLGLLGIALVIFQLFQINVFVTMAMLSVFAVLGFSIVTYIQSLIVEKVLNKEINE